MIKKSITKRRWFYPLVYLVLILVSMLPPITEIPYDPLDTQDVIFQILMVSITPYQSWGWVFHVGTLALVAFIAFRPNSDGRLVAAYFGVNYLLIAALQTNTVTEKYGYALQTGAMISAGLIGILWLVVAIRGKLQASFQNVPRWRWALLPFAVLVFWSPVAVRGSTIVPDFDPILLLTSPDYGLTYCFMTPVTLFLLILFYPKVDEFAYRVTAFNGVIYGVYNLTHWFNPDTRWMGVMHIPLLVLSVAALLMPKVARKRTSRPGSLEPDH
jgi:hypothetical protein